MPPRRRARADPAVSEEDRTRRLRKRRAAVDAIKSKPEYTEIETEARPLTPDPEDLTLSKRDWETAVQVWRNDLKALHEGWMHV